MKGIKKLHRFFKPNRRIGRVDYLKRWLSMLAILLLVSLLMPLDAAADALAPLAAMTLVLFICIVPYALYCLLYLALFRAADIAGDHKRRKWMIFILVWILNAATGGLGHLLLLFAPADLLAPKLVESSETT